MTDGNIVSIFLPFIPIGPAYDLTFCEVRDHSVVIEWQKPLYTGSGPITGYHVEYAKKGTSDWTVANEAPVSHCFLKVTSASVFSTCTHVITNININF